MSNSPGAIHAGRDVIINPGPQARKLSSDQRARLYDMLLKLPKGPIDVVAVLGDGESYAFARELDSLLNSAGWKTQGVSKAVFSGVPAGLIIQVHDKETAPHHAASLQHALGTIGFQSPGELLPQKPENSVTLIVGHNQ